MPAYIVEVNLSHGYYDRKSRTETVFVHSEKSEKHLREAVRRRFSGYNKLIRIVEIKRVDTVDLPDEQSIDIKFDEKWYNNRLIAFDVETTGFSPEKERIIEIGFSEFCRKRRRFVPLKGWLINPGKKLPAKITEITGIEDKDLKDAPSFEDIAQDIIDIIYRAEVLIAHNRGFDISFLMNELCSSGKSISLPPVFCSLELGLKTDMGQGNNKLATLSNLLGVEGENSHRAMDDACLAGNTFLALAKMNEDFLHMSTWEAICYFDVTGKMRKKK